MPSSIAPSSLPHKTKIVLFGSQGMLGSEFFEYIISHPTHYDVIPLSRFHADLTNENAIDAVLNTHAPDIVINMSAFTSVDDAQLEYKQEEAFAINALAPKKMAEWCDAHAIPFIHFSTDYVFSGEEGSVFSESDTPNPINYYGETKAQGESFVLAFPQSFVFRSSWITGGNGHNFVHQMVHLSKKESSIRVARQWGSPSFASDIIAAFVSFLQTADLSIGGVYHLVNEGVASRKEVLEAIQSFLSLPTQIIESDDLESIAKRPVSSALKNTKLPLLPHWKTSLECFLTPEKQKLDAKRRKKGIRTA